MITTSTKKDSPGVFIPPPLIYVAVFLISMVIQQIVPLDRSFFYSAIAANLGIVFILCALIFGVSAFIQFMRSKNTIVPIKSASSLETRGIYSVSRNPMYVSLFLLYAGIGIVKGNWWTLMLFPVLYIIVYVYIIKREESYLERAFGQDYVDYRKRVRRWI
jgi:protein-S-isoprenylcysteine O-methyltransferase Ste14